MVKFAHIADVHLGGWKYEQMQNLNFESFKKAIDICIASKVEFILFAGDLFDSAYPPIETLKETFAQFKRLKDAGIPCFIIAGSHDYSVSGKTFLDVLEKAGFCKNVFNSEERGDQIILNPHIHKNIALYGYPGKKSGLEIPELRRMKLNDAPGMFKIFMLHTTLDKVAGNLPIEFLESEKLPYADYYALGHIHVLFNENKIVYPGPVFPNNFKELEDLKHGSFVIVDTESAEQIKFIKLLIKEIECLEFEFDDSLVATEKILGELSKKDLQDKVILLRINGELKRGKTSDIKFFQIEEFAKEHGAYFLLKNIHDLRAKELEMNLEIKNEGDIEQETIKIYSEKNQSDFNSFVPELMNTLSIEKQEDEKVETFQSRLLSESRRILKF
ncbi:MAG: DNA repair exonuclease [Nanoarchaeota archaeon]|nr:DNA repair exonuclease [Nanoarchaeota archaeon]